MSVKRKIAVVTGSRAEFGILLPVIRELQCRASIDVQLIATGSHLAASKGQTINEIKSFGLDVAGTVPMFLDGDDYEAIGSSVGLGVLGFTRELSRLAPDIVLLLGDRYEIFAVATAAMCLNIPIAHIAGGESDFATCADGNIRNAITKLAHIHFVSTALYAARVRGMGEESWRIYNAGLPSIDGIKSDLITKEALAENLGICLCPRCFLVTYNVVGLRIAESLAELDAMLAALDEYAADTSIVITLSNADAAGREIDARIRAFAEPRRNVHVFQSLGKRRYLSMLNVCDAVIGNSSSGIIEAPSFSVGTVNIGARQDGRMHPPSVVNTGGDKDEIVSGIQTVLSAAFRASLQGHINPFGDGHANELIADVLENIAIDGKLIEKRLDVYPALEV